MSRKEERPSLGARHSDAALGTFFENQLRQWGRFVAEQGERIFENL